MSFLRSFGKKSEAVSSFPAFDEFEKYYNSQNEVISAVLKGKDPKTGKTVSDLMLALVLKFTDVTTAGMTPDKISPYQSKLSAIKERVNKFCLEAIPNISNANGVNEANITSIETSLKTFNELYKKVGVQGYEPPVYRQ
jgi:aryl-alcohol dehydrogenase-like predicted oxidoreductase